MDLNTANKKKQPQNAAIDRSKNEYVRLAVELREVMTFQPKKWRDVLDQSSRILQSNEGNTVPPSLSTQRHKKTPAKSVSVERIPYTRMEDDESRPNVASLSLKQYLHQPKLVQEILEDSIEIEREQADVTIEEGYTDKSDGGDDEWVKSNNIEETQHMDETLQSTTKNTRNTILPVLSIISPRTREGLSRLPAPTREELNLITEMERLAEKGSARRTLYGDLARASSLDIRKRQYRSRKNAVTDSQVTFRLKREPSIKPPLVLRSSFSVSSPTPSSKSQNSVSVGSGNLKRLREEQIQMTFEDVNALHLYYPTPVSKPVELARPPSSIPLPIRKKLQHEHDQLVGQQERVIAQAHHADVVVEQTLSEIRQWLPLEVIYKHGLGEFASAAQQKATELLFRIGRRLLNNMIDQAMIKWKHVTMFLQHQEQEHSALVIECRWRQYAAVCELKRRRHARDILERRQQEMLRLMANLENKSAARITRAIRKYGNQRKKKRMEQQDTAVRRLQRWWRQQQAQWAAIRHQIRKQKRHEAAVNIQRIARGLFARRKRYVLEMIRRVEQDQIRKKEKYQQRDIHRRRIGAILVIQQAFRAWLQRRIDALRRRRAIFDRDVRRIRKVQAHFRGRKARQFVRQHRVQVQMSVLILQCAWRSFVARQRRQALYQARQDMRNEWKVQATIRRNNNTIKLPKTISLKSIKVLDQDEAATCLQAFWRGIRIRKRLKREKAKRKETIRRFVLRQQNKAVICIQRHVRGIQGRSRAWECMMYHSACKIQRVWRGYWSRKEMKRMQKILQAIQMMQQRWRLRQTQANHHIRTNAAQRIQHKIRHFIQRKHFYRTIQSHQKTSEEKAMGYALLQYTKKRILNELLLQSFIYPHLGSNDEDQDQESVQRALWMYDSTLNTWKRCGYNGIWQALYLESTGHSQEIDNSRFTRFLKGLPHGFINQRTFSTQLVDVIFTKMKEPKARTLCFTRYTKAMMMIWEQKFVGISYQEQPIETWYLRFMHEYIVTISYQQGKYRKLMDQMVEKRLEWCISILQRFGLHILYKSRHDLFIITYNNWKQEMIREKAVKVIQQSYRAYQYRCEWKQSLGHLYIQYIDYHGNSVRFQHVETKQILLKRPLFLKGVVCQRIIPLPYPGEEFHVFCERHESSQRMTAHIYCIECEDAMCWACYKRLHDKRMSFQAHEKYLISMCSHCQTETATRECLQCGNGKIPFCDVCFTFLHLNHRYKPMVVMCVECENRVAQWKCNVCGDVYCKRCLSAYHTKGERQSHEFQRLGYLSVLKQAAQDRRSAHAQQLHEQRRKDREQRRIAEEKERQVREKSAIKIQALVRSRQTRKRGRAYMKLVRQTNVAKAQRLKDAPIRMSIPYRLKNIVGLSPPLKSDTIEEIRTRQQRIEKIKRTLFIQRARKQDTTPKERHWTKRSRKQVEQAAKSWCVYGTEIQILRGNRMWKGNSGSILSTQHLFHTGHVLVFIPIANRSVVVDWTHIRPRENDEKLRQPYVSPADVLVDAAYDVHHKLTHVISSTTRVAQLLYLQTLEFKDIVEYAWVLDYNKEEKVPEYWNVVLNKRSRVEPKGMKSLENVHPDKRDTIEKRVAIAKDKLIRLLQPLHPHGKINIAFRRNAIVDRPVTKSSASTIDHELTLANHKRILEHMDAIECAKFWYNTLLPDPVIGGKRLVKLMTTLEAIPLAQRVPTTKDSLWLMVRFLRWLESMDVDEFSASTKTFLKRPEDHQVYIINEMIPIIDKNDMKGAKVVFDRLNKLKEDTLQILVSDAQQLILEKEKEEEKARKQRLEDEYLAQDDP